MHNHRDLGQRLPRHPVDKIKIQSKLNAMKLSISRLHELQNLSQETFLQSFTNFDAAKYNLITAIEAMIDISNHIISRENYEIRPPVASPLKF